MKDDPIFDVEIPIECVQYGAGIAVAQLPDNLQVNTLLTIFITEVRNIPTFLLKIIIQKELICFFRSITLISFGFKFKVNRMLWIN